MIRIDLGATAQEREQTTLLSIICLTIGILAVDLVIPLGFVIWILYLVPLLMSVWLSNRYAPFFIAWFLTIALLLGSLISGSGNTNPSDLANRATFILMIAVVSLLAWEIKNNYASLEAEIVERRTAQVSLEILAGTLEEKVNLRTQELSEVNTKLTHDISERLRVEAALATANQKLKLLSQITRHDISNRVFALLIDLDLARDIATSTNNAELAGYLAGMERTANAIQTQIAFTKDYQEIGAQVPGWYPVEKLVSNAAEQLNLGDVRIDTRVGGLEVFADPMIGKVFYNLIDNALRHGDHVTCITFSSLTEGTARVLFCEDDGIGIAEKDKQHIFTKGYGRDSGLGLFLIQEILAITGITIRETGTPGKGARFEIIVQEGMFRMGSAP